jgi:diguanylate cyclase (GGDEF)-like protein
MQTADSAIRRRRWDLDATVGFIVSLITLTAIGIAAYHETRALIAAGQWLDHTHEVLEVIGAARNDLSAIRNLKSDPQVNRASPQWRDQSQTVLLRAQQHTALLAYLTRDNANQQARVSILQNTWKAESHTLDSLSHASSAVKPFACATPNPRSEISILRMTLDQMADEENRLLETRAAEAQDHAARVAHSVLLLAIFMGIFLILACRANWKDIRERRRAAAALRDLQSQLQRALDKEKELSRIDSLTGLPNRRAFYETLENERMRALRYRHPLTIAYVDVDNFKRINDTQGHAVGDAVLRDIGQCLRENLRTSDIVARLGGDEFAVLLPETEATAAEHVVRKLHLHLRERMALSRHDVSLSIGIAAFLCPNASIDDLVRDADELMYMVKATGKANVSVAVFG